MDLLTRVQLISALGVSFGLWGIALIPTYLVVRQVGVVHLGPEKLEPASTTKEDEIVK